MPTTVKHETDQVFIALLGRRRRLWDPVSAKNINKRNDVILRQLNRRRHGHGQIPLRTEAQRILQGEPSDKSMKLHQERLYLHTLLV